MKILARCNGTLLVDDGARVGLASIGGGWLGTALFVSVLLTVIPAINGVVMFAIGQLVAGGVLLGVAALAIFAAGSFAKKRAALRAAPTPAPWLVLEAGQLRDAAGNVLAPLSQVRVVRTFQVGSSSKALALELPGKKLVIARGTPFGDSVDDLEAALRARLS